jgi:16S rRNA C967 or C1407 C5-methylase (RsmB/RsmF family)
VVRHALDAYPCLRLVDASAQAVHGRQRLGRPGLDGFGLSEAERRMVLRFDPADEEVDSIGFFIAKFTKEA